MRNKRGFTLIEIIVSLMIASIAMGIATTLILNSMGYFSKTASSDIDKQVLDGIKEYYQNELIYASDVRISIDKPDDSDWHWLYVKNGVCYRDDNYGYDGYPDRALYTSDFYNNKYLKIEARGFDNYRLDIKLYLFKSQADADVDSKAVYKTATTIELLNFKQNLNITGTTSTPFSKENNTFDLANISSEGYKIYYKTKQLDITTEETIDDDYWTVGGEYKRCKTSDNVKKWVELNENNDNHETYGVGTFVKYDNVWYRALKDTNNTAIPTTSSDWKRIETKYNENSLYYKGDIVSLYNETLGKDQYYQLTGLAYTTPGSGPMQTPDFWSAGKDTVEEVMDTTGLKPTCNFGASADDKQSYTGTVADEFYCLNLPNGKNYSDYILKNDSDLTNLNIKTGDFVVDTYRGGSTLYWYRAISDHASTVRPGSGSMGLWKIITPYKSDSDYKNIAPAIYDKDSVYEKGDVVQYAGLYYKVLNTDFNGEDRGFIQDQNPVSNPTLWMKINENELQKGKLKCN